MNVLLVLYQALGGRYGALSPLLSRQKKKEVASGYVR